MAAAAALIICHKNNEETSLAQSHSIESAAVVIDLSTSILRRSDEAARNLRGRRRFHARGDDSAIRLHPVAMTACGGSGEGRNDSACNPSRSCTVSAATVSRLGHVSSSPFRRGGLNFDRQLQCIFGCVSTKTYCCRSNVYMPAVARAAFVLQNCRCSANMCAK